MPPTAIRTKTWLVMLGCGLAVVVAYRLAALLDLPSIVQTLLYWFTSAFGAVGVLVGVRMNRPAARWPWYLLAAGQLAELSADLIYYGAAQAGITLPYPSVGDLFYLLDYPLAGLGLFLLVRRRTPGWDWASLIDATIVAVSGALLAWVAIIGPSASTDGLTTAGRLVSAAYPTGDLLLLLVGARLLMGAGGHPPALRMLAAYLSLVIVPDALFSLQTLNGTYHEGGWLETLWMSAALLLGLLGLHPSMREVDELSPTTSPESGVGRLSLLAVASLLAPATLLAQFLRGAPLYIPLTCAACGLLFLLVLARMAGLVAAQRRLAITDGLTGLYTRRHFEQQLAAAGERAGLGVLLLDIDHFKSVNDTYGHHGGDQVLREVARRLGRAVRPDDLVARYGGEEFAVILPGTGPAEARGIADRIHQAIRSAPIGVDDSNEVGVTVSLGVATLPADAASPADLVRLADQLLYRAKETGRDRVVTATTPRPGVPTRTATDPRRASRAHDPGRPTAHPVTTSASPAM